MRSNSASRSAGSAGKSLGWKKSPLLVPPRIHTAGILRRGMIKSAPFEKFNHSDGASSKYEYLTK
jgi:hypothetical protein